MYAHIPLVSGGRLLVPSFPTVALAPVLFLLVRANLTITDELFLPKIAFVFLLSIAFSPGYVYVEEKFLSLVQTCMAIAVAIMTVHLMKQLRPNVLERTLLVLWVVVVVGSVLEVLDVIRAFSDSFRVWAYGDQYTIYRADERDIEMVGWPRPKLFSTEPSHVTKLFIASVNAWLLVRPSWRKAIVVAGATLVMLVIMGSPMLIVSISITLSILLWNRQSSFRTRLAMVLVALLVGMIFAVFFAESTVSTVADRMEKVGRSTESGRLTPSSEDQRIVYPYLTLAYTLSDWPAFGVGIGGKEVVMEQTTFRLRDPIDALGNNATAEFGIYLGLVGGTWFFILLLKHASYTGVQRLGLMLVLGGMFSQLNGGIDSFRYWGFNALLWGALAVADSKKMNE
jgi:hypothetical protein